MKNTLFGSLLTLLSVVVLAGCNSAPPPIVAKPVPPPAAPPHKGPWTTADKIAVIEKSGMPAAQKKATIDQLKASGG